MKDNFNTYSSYYDLLYKDKDYKKEAEYVLSLLIENGNNIKKILEFGSGTGRHGLILKEMGYSVFGIERSGSMVSIAQQAGLDCKVADITNFELNEKFDAVISLFHVISYLTSNESLINAFQNAYKSLKSGGIFLFDTWYTPAVHHQKALPKIKKMNDENISVIRFAEPKININDNIVDVQFTVLTKDLHTGELTEFMENHPMRHFSIPEIDLLARHTGFTLIHAEEFLTSKMPSEETWGICFILKKN